MIYTSENEYGKGEVRSWASLIDEATIEQAQRMARSPIIEGYLALMPDAHFGYGPPVGSALKTAGGVMPYAVGVDIGCGMIAVKLNIERSRLAGFEQHILGWIRDFIPSGVGTAHQEISEAARAFIRDHGIPPGIQNIALDLLRRETLEKTSLTQFGTLGAGNHFAEVSEDKDGAVWLVVHSGSRGIGNTLATAHWRRAKALCKKEGIKVEHPELVYFPEDSIACLDYLNDMEWCQRYAFAQREAMMDRMVEAVQLEVGPIWELDRINCHHNYAEARTDARGWLTRKGAINAELGCRGVIPGSMGAATYIVEGLGNTEAYCTSPHGAGRLRGRNASRKELSVDDFKAQMAGKTWQDRDAEKLLDEAPEAYKPIEVVMADSASLVRPLAVLTQFINYKGL